MGTPTTRATFKDYCLRSLGKPVIEINVDPDQVDDRIDEALQYFSQYHYDGVERMYLKYKITDASSNGYTITANGNTAASTSKPFNDYFTVPTSNLTAITNTQILTCNDSNVINDASTSSHTITRNGDAVPTKFNPF